ncbi:hypothetical protein OEZ85_012774 [Tetradesmus obliquus]|uniref:Uncharacterized protein n=1 Tax=Tetradesmus obliquus TaxID=3088 RepID=A0ABY8U3X0_TETOB|nr:hypothetical protein OEZ85_012774 [Tetradesmus obliquus]
MHHHADAFASLLQKDPGHYLELLMVSANSVVPHAAEELLQIIKDSHSSLSICSTADVHHMLEAAILRSHGTIIGDIAALPAAAGISSEQMCQLLRAALLLQDSEAAKKKSRVELYGDEAADVPKRDWASSSRRVAEVCPVGTAAGRMPSNICAAQAPASG